MVYRYPAGNPLHPEALKEKQRALRDGFSTPLTLRAHRSLSWLRRAEAEQEDQDVRFILLWIGFNAAYAGDVEASASSSAPEGERGLFQSFFSTLVKSMGVTVSTTRFGSGSLRISASFSTIYIYHPFWQHQRGVSGYEDWEQELERGRLAFNHALREHDLTP